MFKISISKNAPEQTSLELLPETGLAAQGSRSVPVADIFDRSNDRALLRTRAVLSPEEAIVEIARRSPANVREQLCRMVSDLGYPSLSVREAQRFLEGILQPELLDSFIVDGNALIHAVRSDPESFQVKIATEMRASHLSDEESGRVASQRPSDRISDFLTRKVLVPLVDKGLRTLKARTECSRLPCIITLGIERGDYLAMLGLHAHRVLLCDSRQHVFEAISPALSDCSFVSLPFPWERDEDINPSTVLVLGDSFRSPNDAKKALKWITEYIAAGGTLVSAVQSPRPLFASPADIRRALGDGETQISLIAVQDLLLKHRIPSERHEYTVAVTANAVKQDISAVRSLIEDSLSVEARINRRGIEDYIKIHCRGGVVFNYPIDFLIATGSRAVPPVDNSALLEIFRGEEASASRALTQYLGTAAKLKALDGMAHANDKLVTLNNDCADLREHLHARLILSHWTRDESNLPDMFSFMVNLSHIHELLPMIFREVVLWQRSIDAISVKYTIPSTIISVLNRQLRKLLTPPFDKITQIIQEYKGPLQADALIQEWLLTRPIPAYENPIPRCLSLIHGSELPEGINAVSQAARHVAPHDDSQSKSARSTSHQGDATQPDDRGSKIEGGDPPRLGVVSPLISADRSFHRLYRRLIHLRERLTEDEKSRVTGWRRQGTRFSQDSLTILDVEWNPEKPTASYLQYRVLGKDTQQGLLRKFIDTNNRIKQELLTVPGLQAAAIRQIINALDRGGLNKALTYPPKSDPKEYQTQLNQKAKNLRQQLKKIEHTHTIEEAKRIANEGLPLFKEMDLHDLLKNQLINLLSSHLTSGTHEELRASASDLNSTWDRIAKREARRLFYRTILQEHNERLIVWLVRKHWGQSTLPPALLSMEDLIQEGQLALSRAIDRYSFSGGSPFHTYAHACIYRRTVSAVREGYRQIRVPAEQSDNMREIRRAQGSLLSQFSSVKLIPPERIAEVTGVSLTDVQALLPLMSQPQSMDAPLSASTDSTVGDTVFKQSSQSVVDEAGYNLLKVDVISFFPLLDRRQQDILNLRLGLGVTRVREANGQIGFITTKADSGMQLPLSIISDLVNLAKERVYQIEQKARDKIAAYGRASQRVYRIAQRRLDALGRRDPRLLLPTSQLQLEEVEINLLLNYRYYIVAQCLGATPNDFRNLPNSGAARVARILFALEQIGFLWRDDHWLDTAEL